MTKLQLKLKRQNAKTEQLLTGYSLSQKSSRSRNNGKYKNDFTNYIKL